MGQEYLITKALTVLQASAQAAAQPQAMDVEAPVDEYLNNVQAKADELSQVHCRRALSDAPGP